MIKLETTKRDKIILSILAAILVIYLVTSFFLVTPFKNYQQAKLLNNKMTGQIEEYYQQAVHLQDMKKEYLETEKYLNEIRSRLSINGAELLDILTKNSPVENFSVSALWMKDDKEKQAEIARHHYEIKFKSDFKKIGEYLIYLETSLPISFIENIEIKPAKNEPHNLETTLSGFIYKVD